MSNQTDKSPQGHGFWRMVRRLLFFAACLVTLIALLYAEEDWRGKHAWENYKHEWEAKGEKFDFASFVPPPVPDDQNFTMTPLLAPLFDFNPEPRQPGQGAWRDTNGLNRVDNFASGLFAPPSRSQPGQRRWTDPKKADYDIWWELLGTNSTNHAFASPTEAAGELEKALEQYRPELDEVTAASRRPYSRFNINYQTEPSFGILLPHLGRLKRFQEAFALRSRAESVLGQTEAAHRDIGVMLVLARSSKDEPFLISGLVELALLQLTLPEIQQGLARHQWTDAELVDWENQLGRIDLLAEYGHVMRAELATTVSALDYFASNPRQVGLLSGISYEGKRDDPPFAVLQFVPSGWFRQNQLAISRVGQEAFLAPVDAPHHRVHAAEAARWSETLNREFAHGFLPYQIFAKLLLPAYGGASLRYSAGQVNVDQTIVACALERYRLANGAYPDSLAALTPKYAAALPNDVISGEPLKYRRTEDGQFLLYSVGWNEQDDGGVIAMTKERTPHRITTEGDWVWPHIP